MIREQLIYQPRWSGVFEGWAKKWVRNHFWRVAKHFQDQEDALQECAFLFYWARRKYAGRYDSPQHFMALYKTIVYREWIAFAADDRRLRVAEDYPEELMVTHELPLGEMAVAFHQQSKELQLVLSVISEAPSDVLKILFKHASINDMNTRIKRWCGIKTRRNVIRELKRLTAS